MWTGNTTEFCPFRAVGQILPLSGEHLQLRAIVRETDTAKHFPGRNAILRKEASFQATLSVLRLPTNS